MDEDKKLHVLLLGSGGREHAIAEALAASDSVSQVTVVPGICSFGRRLGPSLTLGGQATEARRGFQRRPTGLPHQRGSS